MDDRTLVGCVISIIQLVALTPLIAFSIWLTPITWDWPWFGVGWWTGNPAPDPALVWVACSLAWIGIFRSITEGIDA
jgi:hypothetical protein